MRFPTAAAALLLLAGAAHAQTKPADKAAEKAAAPAPAATAPAAPAPAPAAAPAAAAKAGSSAMDGTKWSTHVKPDEAAAKKGEKEVDSTLIFEKGMFSSSEWVKYGFREAPYELAKDGEASKFKAEAVNRAGDKAEWAAEFKGDAVTGTIKTTKKDGTTLGYSFSGKKSK